MKFYENFESHLIENMEDFNILLQQLLALFITLAPKSPESYSTVKQDTLQRFYNFCSLLAPLIKM